MNSTRERIKWYRSSSPSRSRSCRTPFKINVFEFVWKREGIFIICCLSYYASPRRFGDAASRGLLIDRVNIIFFCKTKTNFISSYLRNLRLTIFYQKLLFRIYLWFCLGVGFFLMNDLHPWCIYDFCRQNKLAI